MIINNETILNSSKQTRGFTLIEVLIALAIFSIGFLAMGALQSGALMRTGEIGRKIEASAILSDKAEQLRALPFYEDSDYSVHPSQLKETSGFKKESAANGRYDVHWKVVDNKPIGEREMPRTGKEGTITVSKTITLTVTRAGGHSEDDALTSVEFVKVISESILF